MALADMKWLDLEAAIGWGNSRSCGEKDCSTKLATGAAFLSTEVGIYSILPVYTSLNWTEPYYRVIIGENQLTLPETWYLRDGSLDEESFKDFGERSYCIVTCMYRQRQAFKRPTCGSTSHTGTTVHAISKR
jgi:hypothetical protein